MRFGALVMVLSAALARPALVAAQDPAQIEAVAPLLRIEDRREFDPGILRQALNDPDPLVRQTAVMTVGRLGDPRGTALLVPMLADHDPGVVTNVFFAFGLLRDTVAVEPIVARLRSPDSLSADALGEAATALARIGGGNAARFLGSVLSGASEISRTRRSQMVPNALLDGWKLGALMPVPEVLHYASDTGTDTRWRAIYSLGRIRAPAAGSVVQRAVRDQSWTVRDIAAKWLTKQFADTAGLAANNIKAELVRALEDDQAGVRINALGSLATFSDSTVAVRMIPLLTDPDPNVRVAAAMALGSARSSTAARALDALMDKHDANSWAMRRAALASLAHVDTALFAKRAVAWLTSSDFRDRMAALQAWSTVTPANSAVFRTALADPDARVQAAALSAWRPRTDTALAAAARARLRNANIGVRAAAADALRMTATAGDLDALAAAWRQGQADGESTARLAVLNTMRALSQREKDLLAQLDSPQRRDFLQRPDDPVIRADAVRTWPELARAWGQKWPIDTHRSLDDYRNIARTYLLAGTDPHVFVEVEGRGQIEIDLLAHEAPLTVANFLTLVDGHKFDGNRWHRVVPNFVVQDGDPTGTGNGGPGWSIRDEINRERYVLPMVGMALSGQDTGGSQWFINLSTQPHLDGQYTIFGKVTGASAALGKIVQGDVIRSIHR